MCRGRSSVPSCAPGLLYQLNQSVRPTSLDDLADIISVNSRPKRRRSANGPRFSRQETAYVLVHLLP